ncbi:hypothetical protein [Janthinobacterium sp. JC611]|uniref:hypothetical protein n=1 Tax=Janthinobacterium sp. JC611 TaxID=2816201 RepID=UPI001BFDEE20|nr:hypothetical protein [Janthinobacterium sp. JC611]
MKLKVSRGSGSVANPRRTARFPAEKAAKKCPLAGHQRKKSRFLKIFPDSPKVPPFAAVNNYMNSGNRSGRRRQFLNIFKNKPKVPVGAAVISVDRLDSDQVVVKK